MPRIHTLYPIYNFRHGGVMKAFGITVSYTLHTNHKINLRKNQDYHIIFLFSISNINMCSPTELSQIPRGRCFILLHYQLTLQNVYLLFIIIMLNYTFLYICTTYRINALCITATGNILVCLLLIYISLLIIGTILCKLTHLIFFYIPLYFNSK